jgi:hypothetical protein
LVAEVNSFFGAAMHPRSGVYLKGEMAEPDQEVNFSGSEQLVVLKSGMDIYLSLFEH